MKGEAAAADLCTMKFESRAQDPERARSKGIWRCKHYLQSDWQLNVCQQFAFNTIIELPDAQAGSQNRTSCAILITCHSHHCKAAGRSGSGQLYGQTQ